mmetsp:Transcript_176134/g.564720  ORF Transcript_176134/g.564720 Transcript_176134/m.564720 type:complete len:201 (-) Transcript_176134:343-945(-)
MGGAPHERGSKASAAAQTGPTDSGRKRSVAPAGAASEEVHRRVVHEVPDEAADEAEGALVHLRGLDDLLLDGTGAAPDAHEAGVLDPIGAGNEAGVVRAQGGGEHACTPRPMHGGQLDRVAHVRGLEASEDELVHLLNVPDGDDGLLLTRVRDLGDGRNGPGVHGARAVHATVVAVADGEDAGVALLVLGPHLAVARLHR